MSSRPTERWKHTQSFGLLPDELFLTSPYDNGLDYTFVSVEPAAAAKFGTVELKRAAYVIQSGTYANIVQHPDGRPQEIVLHDNEVVNDDGVFCPTSPTPTTAVREARYSTMPGN